jgi:hypothetical protein
MSKIMYCTLCKRDVAATKDYNWLLFILLLCIGIFPGILYFLYFSFKSSNKCPICSATCVSREQ